MSPANRVLQRALAALFVVCSFGSVVDLAAETVGVCGSRGSPRSTTKPWAELDTIPLVLQRPRGAGLPSQVFDLFAGCLLLDIQDNFCGVPPVVAYHVLGDTVFVRLVFQAEICIPEYSGSRYVGAMELSYGAPVRRVQLSMPTRLGQDTVVTVPLP